MFSILFSDCKFMMFPPSMIAAGSIGAATHGLNNTLPHLDVKLLQRLHQITGIEMVSFDTFCIFHLFSLLFPTFWWIRFLEVAHEKLVISKRI